MDQVNYNYNTKKQVSINFIIAKYQLHDADALNIIDVALTILKQMSQLKPNLFMN